MFPIVSYDLYEQSLGVFLATVLALILWAEYLPTQYQYMIAYLLQS